MRQLKPNIYMAGAIDWDRRLFDELIPLPDGTSYNAYLIRGSEKTALLDTVDPTKTSVLIDNLTRLKVDKLDYVVAHHAEQDHSGSLPDILLLYPQTKVVTNAKCRDMLIDEMEIEEDRFIVIEDGQEISLGDKTLKFVFTPWVHWPETMATYIKEDKILFPCDFFGSHLATSNLYADENPVVYEGAKRYYAEIMMPFRGPIKKNLEKIADLQIDMIAPSHGPVYNKPQLIIEAYKDWVSDDVKNEVIVAYVSMHGSTKKMVEYFVEALIDRNIEVRQFNLTDTDTGKLAISLVDAATMVFGAPTVLGGTHPAAAYAATLANSLRPKTKFASVIGSYGWAARTAQQITTLIPHLKAEMLNPVIAKGVPKDADYVELDRLADDILARHKKIKIID